MNKQRYFLGAWRAPVTPFGAVTVPNTKSPDLDNPSLSVLFRLLITHRMLSCHPKIIKVMVSSSVIVQHHLQISEVTTTVAADTSTHGSEYDSATPIQQ